MPTYHTGPGGVWVQDADQPAGVRNALRPFRSNIATRVLGARCVASAAFLGWTAHVTMRVAQEFDAIRLLMLNPCATDIVNVKAACSVGATLASPLNSAGTWTNVTWSGSATKTLGLAADAANPTLVLSDWIALEGDSTKLLSVRVYIPAAGNTEHPLHSLSMNAAGWAAYANREWIQRSQSGDYVTTPASMNAAGNDTTSPIAGIQYMARGQVLATMMFADSIGHGTGSTISCDSYGHKGVVAAAAATGMAIEYANMGWSGQTTAQILARLTSHLPSLLPHVVLYGGCFSPNDGTPSAVLTAAQKARIETARSLCATYNADFVGVTGVPRNATATTSSYSASADDFRKGVNNSAVRVLPHYIDLDSIAADSQATGSAARYKMLATGYPFDHTDSGDWIHPSELCHQAASVLARALVCRFL